MSNVAPTAERNRLMDLARLELSNRHRRIKALGGGTLSEPAWAMLLDLYVAEQTRTKIQTTYLVEESNMSHATGLRYVKYLIDLRMVTRSMNERDKRSRYVELTDRGRAVLEQYLSEAVAALDVSGL